MLSQLIEATSIISSAKKWVKYSFIFFISTWFFIFLILFLSGLWNHNGVLVFMSIFVFLTPLLLVIYFLPVVVRWVIKLINPKDENSGDNQDNKKPLTLDIKKGVSWWQQRSKTTHYVLIFLFLLFLSSVGILAMIAKASKGLGHDLASTAKNISTGMYDSFTNSVGPETLPIAENSVKVVPDGYEVTVYPGQKSEVIVLPDNGAGVSSPAKIYFNPVGTDEVIDCPTYDEYVKTGKGFHVGAGEYSIFSKATDTFTCKIRTK
jgi:hypothetical protein